VTKNEHQGSASTQEDSNKLPEYKSARNNVQSIFHFYSQESTAVAATTTTGNNGNDTTHTDTTNIMLLPIPNKTSIKQSHALSGVIPLFPADRNRVPRSNSFQRSISGTDRGGSPGHHQSWSPWPSPRTYRSSQLPSENQIQIIRADSYIDAVRGFSSSSIELQPNALTSTVRSATASGGGNILMQSRDNNNLTHTSNDDKNHARSDINTKVPVDSKIVSDSDFFMSSRGGGMEREQLFFPLHNFTCSDCSVDSLQDFFADIYELFDCNFDRLACLMIIYCYYLLLLSLLLLLLLLSSLLLLLLLLFILH
jgi:hypothetical protein